MPQNFREHRPLHHRQRSGCGGIGAILFYRVPAGGKRANDRAGRDHSGLTSSAIPASIEPGQQRERRIPTGFERRNSDGVFPCFYLAPEQGRYVMHIHVTAGDTASLAKEFSVHWNDMPLSLYDLDFAVIGRDISPQTANTTTFGAAARGKDGANSRSFGGSATTCRGRHTTK